MEDILVPLAFFSIPVVWLLTRTYLKARQMEIDHERGTQGSDPNQMQLLTKMVEQMQQMNERIQHLEQQVQTQQNDQVALQDEVAKQRQVQQQA